MSCYEVLPMITNDEGEALSASYTAHNGIRVEIMNFDISPDWAVFDFKPDQAEILGNALVRWAQDRAK